MSDAEKLREAIADGRRIEMCAPGASWQPTLKALLSAAEAHLATLPKTKMVEVWHVEYAEQTADGSWYPDAAVRTDRAVAITLSMNLEKNDRFACIRVTGPHQQEVPAT